jgi:nicotinamidase-related amidase
MDALLVIDMQHASVSGTDKHDIRAVEQRINVLARRIRERDGRVVFVQHDGNASEGLEPLSDGWQVTSALRTEPNDLFVRKTLNDAFAHTTLDTQLRELGVDHVIVCGWATDFCVDATVRSAVSRDFHVTVAADCHTLSDRPHLKAGQVIEHHNWLWSNLLSRRLVCVKPASQI